MFRQININVHHPEIQDGEVFLCNASSEVFINGIFWKTKRSAQAYTEDGFPIPLHLNLFSVFVQLKELINEDFVVKSDGSVTNSRDKSAPVLKPIKNLFIKKTNKELRF